MTELTPQQLEIVALLVRDLTCKQVAERLGLKVSVVSNRLQHMKRRLGYDTLFGLAFRLGLMARDALEKEGAEHGT